MSYFVLGREFDLPGFMSLSSIRTDSLGACA